MGLIVLQQLLSEMSEEKDVVKNKINIKYTITIVSWLTDVKTVR